MVKFTIGNTVVSAWSIQTRKGRFPGRKAAIRKSITVSVVDLELRAPLS
jgi:hypothetical protein